MHLNSLFSSRLPPLLLEPDIIFHIPAMKLSFILNFLRALEKNWWEMISAENDGNLGMTWTAGLARVAAMNEA